MTDTLFTGVDTALAIKHAKLLYYIKLIGCFIMHLAKASHSALFKAKMNK